MQNSLTRKPIEIKIATVVAVAVVLNDASMSVLEQALQQMTGGMADFFENEFAILDIESIADQSIDWPTLIALFKSFGLNAVAVRHAREADHTLIQSHGLSIDVVNKNRQEELPNETPSTSSATTATTPASANKTATAPVAPPASALPTMIVDTPVRAGQRIYARGCDLIVTASVNNGAEVIADGSIHIYAALRGRALAGASGNIQARIYAQTMEPELVSIAGTYRTFENGFPQLSAQHPVQIKLIGDHIEVSSINPAG
ncbi:MAG: septum site-determining protein MinC [Burkholderiaceae bacterium]|nr:septum site-determining protein MinC [Burkholderiaceae bacterium]